MSPTRTPVPETRTSTRLRNQILAKHAPHLLKRRKAPTPTQIARRQKVRWIHRTAQEDGEGCRDWPWGATSHGYGVVRWEGRLVKVGHLTLELSGQSRPTGQIMLHSCDRPVCAAPWHLRWGTYKDNADDRFRRAA